MSTQIIISNKTCKVKNRQLIYTRSKKFRNNVYIVHPFNEERMSDKIKDNHVFIRISTKHSYDFEGDHSFEYL